MDDAKARNLLELARKALKNAYAPYSKLRVGAAILTKEGKVFTGVNVENASYGLTICAERVAVFKAVSEGFREFEAIALTSDRGKIMPCGACRQVLAEFSPHIKVIVGDPQGFEIYDLKDLLPHNFDSNIIP